MEVLLAQPRGFCAGVTRAIEIVERALALHGPPIYVLHEIVHNRHVVERLRERGAVFVEDLAEVPEGATVIFSAHGVSEEIETHAAARGLAVIDATCPLVTKVHRQAQRYSLAGNEVVLIGHQGHPEVEGTRGRIPATVYVLSTVEEVWRLEVRDPQQLAYVTQTTLSIDDTRDVIAALEERFPGIRGPALDDICYATQNRQNALRAMIAEIDLLLVVGAHNSSNSNRLRELGLGQGIPAYLVESAADLDPAWLRPDMRVGITAGASAPERLVQDVVRGLTTHGVVNVSEMPGEPEDTVFGLPPEVDSAAASKAKKA